MRSPGMTAIVLLLGTLLPLVTMHLPSMVGAQGSGKFTSTDGIVPGFSVTCEPTPCTSSTANLTALAEGQEVAWRSPTQVKRVNVTMDLRGVHELLVFEMEMLRLPKTAILLRSHDGKDFTPYQYYAYDCSTAFNLLPDVAPQVTEEAVCVSTGSSPTGDDDLIFNPLDTQRPPKGADRDYHNNPRLQAFVQTRYLRVAFVEYHDRDTAVDPFGNPLLEIPFYEITSLTVSARCFCNGHASTCTLVDVSGTLESVCECTHNTTGSTCGECLPLFNNRDYSPGTPSAANACRQCNCNGHAQECVFQADVGSGVCIECSNNTLGNMCEACSSDHYRPSAEASAPCIDCECSSVGALSSQCDVQTGQCVCKTHVTGRVCDACVAGAFDFGGDPTRGCRHCACSEFGSTSGVCNATTGQCPCKDGRTGRTCSQCAVGFRTSGEPGECMPCNEQCGDDGCIAAGTVLGFACRSCRNAVLDGMCVGSCPQGHWNDNGVCRSKDRRRASRVQTPTSTELVLASAHAEPMLMPSSFAAFCFGAGGCDGTTALDCNTCGAFTRILSPDADITECVASCEHLEFPDPSTAVCTACHQECKLGCTGPGPHECRDEQCRRFSLQNGTCVSSCPRNTFSDADSGVCVPCSSRCSGGCWGEGEDKCLACDDASVAIVQVQGGVARILCAEECPLGSFPDGSRTCQSCDPACAECTDASPSSCTRCLNFVDITFDTCVASCPPNTFTTGTPPPNSTVTSPQYCTPCHPLCNGCSGPGNTDCHRCRGVLTVDGGCVNMCPTDTYERDGLCLPCSEQCSGGCMGPGAAECGSCANVLGSDGVCRDACLAWEYEDNTGVCRACSALCSDTSPGCGGPDADDCHQCGGVLFDGESSGTDTSRCRASCPDGFYADETTGICVECDPACDGCNGPQATECIACATARYNGTCVVSCPTNTFLSPAGVCTACNAQYAATSSCTGPTAHECTPAPNQPANTNPCAAVRHDGACVSTCPYGFFEDTSTRDCTACDMSCDACSGDGPQDCTGCRRGFYLTTSGECDACHPLCGDGACSGPSASDCSSGCLAFTDVRTPQQPVCVLACPANTYSTPMQPHTCRACHQQCSGGCTGPAASECMACAGVRNEGRCVSVCPENQAADDAGDCGDCHDECRDGCTRPNDAAACTACSHHVENGACVRQCSTGSPFLAEGECLTSCPGDFPFYNDTRQSASFVVSRCVAACGQLGEPLRTFVSEAAPFRCTTEAQAQTDTNAMQGSSSDDTAATTNILIVVVCVVAFLLLVLVVLYLRRGSSETAPISDTPLARSRRSSKGVGSMYSMDALNQPHQNGVGGGSQHRWSPTWANNSNSMLSTSEEDVGYITVESPSQPTNSTHV